MVRCFERYCAGSGYVETVELFQLILVNAMLCLAENIAKFLFEKDKKRKL